MKAKLNLKGRNINCHLSESINRAMYIYTVYQLLRKKFTCMISLPIQTDFYLKSQKFFCIPKLNGKCFV